MARVFGPESLTWRVHTDPMMFVAGVRSLYLQSLPGGATPPGSCWVIRTLGAAAA